MLDGHEAKRGPKIERVRREDIEQIMAPLTLLFVYCEFAVQLLAVSKILISVEGLGGVLPAQWSPRIMHVCTGLITKEVEEILVDDCTNERGNELSDLHTPDLRLDGELSDHLFVEGYDS